MRASPNLLHQSVDRAARIVALDLLEAAAKQRGRLGNKRNTEALHDFRVAVRRLRSWLRAFDEWLDDSVPRKASRRLKKAARATNASRDADVRLVWLRQQRAAMNTAERPGLSWMLKRINEERAESFEADVKKGARSFDKANRGLDRSLREYSVRIDADEEAAQLFDADLGGLMRDHADDLSRRLGAVHTMSNARQIHEARISAKRLRYLIDPVADLVPGVKELVDELGKLQDALGDSHDALLFADELAKTSADDAEDARLAPGLSALSQRLKTHAEKVFSDVEHWLDGDARQLLDRVYIIADALAPPQHRKLELVRENSTA